MNKCGEISGIHRNVNNEICICSFYRSWLLIFGVPVPCSKGLLYKQHKNGAGIRMVYKIKKHNKTIARLMDYFSDKTYDIFIITRNIYNSVNEHE